MKCLACQSENPENTRFCGNCGKSLSPAPTGEAVPLYPPTLTLQTPTDKLERGTTFAGRYEIIEELGSGGMGRVYKVFDQKIKEMTALKLLKAEIASNEATVARFRNEIKLARKISHRHVCRMYDMNEEGFSAYITMEYVPGEDLKSFIRRAGHLTEAKVIFLGKQIAEGLAEAHRLSVIHRDLKPQNIMIDLEGHARIMDFGVARVTATKGMTGTGVVIGTPEYMSPEQAEAKEVDQRSDIYSLGAVLFEMATGQVPFEGETPLSIAIKHKSVPPQNPRDLKPHISESLSRVILKCLEKEKKKRYQKAEELLADFQKMEKGLPAGERILPRRKPLTSQEITVKLSVKKVLFPALIAVIVVVFGVLAWKITTRKSALSQEAVYEPVGKPPSGFSDKESLKTLKEALEGTPLGRSIESEKVLDFLNTLLKGAAQHIKQEDLNELEKMMALIKDKLPTDSSYLAMWSDIQTQIQEGKRQQEAGNLESSQKSYVRSQSQMRKLLTLVQEKDNADVAKAEMETARKRAEEALAKKRNNLLYWVASEKEKDAQDAYGSNDFSGAKTLYRILARIYLMSITGGNEDACLKELQGYVREVRSEANKTKASAKDTWLFDRAKEEEDRANTMLGEKQYAESAEFFILSAFLYEKAREVALESTLALGVRH